MNSIGGWCLGENAPLSSDVWALGMAKHLSYPLVFDSSAVSWCVKMSARLLVILYFIVTLAMERQCCLVSHFGSYFRQVYFASPGMVQNVWFGTRIVLKVNFSCTCARYFFRSINRVHTIFKHQSIACFPPCKCRLQRMHQSRKFKSSVYACHTCIEVITVGV